MSGLKEKRSGTTSGVNTGTNERGYGYKSCGFKVGTSSKTNEHVYEGCCGGQKTYTSTSRSSGSTFRPGMDDEE